MSARRLGVPFVLVTGGKGGVGKTTVAANLGVALAKEGRRVLLVDLDLGLANLDVALGLRPAHRVEEALAGSVPLEACIAEGPGGVDLLPAASGSEELSHLGPDRRARLLELLRTVEDRYELIIGDSAAGVGSDVLAFAALADRVVVVTTPDLAALTDAYGLIKALDRHGATHAVDIPTPEVVVNHAKGVEEGRAVARKLRAICERFLARSPRQAGWLPRSAAVERSQSEGSPFVLKPRKALENVCMAQITGRLTGLARPLAGSAAGALALGKNF